MFGLGKKELPLCKCGCGQFVERKTKKYFADHFRNPVGAPVTDAVPEIELVIEKVAIEPVVRKVKPAPAAIKVDAPKVKKVIKKIKKGTPSEQLSLAGKVVKAKTTPIPGGKISKQNLLNVGLGIYTC